MNTAIFFALIALISFVLDKMKDGNQKKQNTHVIVDREKEIYSNSKIIDKEKIVNDVIFSEILSKPKSKR